MHTTAAPGKGGSGGYRACFACIARQDPPGCIIAASEQKKCALHILEYVKHGSDLSFMPIGSIVVDCPCSAVLPIPRGSGWEPVLLSHTCTRT